MADFITPNQIETVEAALISCQNIGFFDSF